MGSTLDLARMLIFSGKSDHYPLVRMSAKVGMQRFDTLYARKEQCQEATEFLRLR